MSGKSKSFVKQLYQKCGEKVKFSNGFHRFESYIIGSQKRYCGGF